MPDERRECWFDTYGEIKRGMFVKYAAIKFMDEGNHPYTAEQAIVELDDGTVITVDPAQIRFR